MFDQPNVALAQAHLYSEILVKMIIKQKKIEEIYPVTHSERINKLFRQNAIEEDLYKKLEMIRKKGNKVVHNVEEADFNDVLPIHEVLFDASVWYMQVYVRYDFEAPQYEPPAKAKSETPIDSLVKPYVDERLEAMMKEINEKLEELRAEKSATNQKLRQLRKLSEQKERWTAKKNQCYLTPSKKITLIG